MNKVYICQIDCKINEGHCTSAKSALKRVINFITKTIDPTFPEKEFFAWVESDSEKPFRWNRCNYHWSERD